MDRPEGPAEVPLVKDLKMRRMSKEGPRVTGLLATSGIVG